jgi:Flp pilus assembly protein TadG
MTLDKRSQYRRGSSMVEAAFVFPVLLILTFGCIEFGHYFYIKHTLQAAAREGARAAVTSAVADGNTLVTTAVGNVMTAANIPVSKYTLSVRNSTDQADLVAGNQTAGTAILVKVNCTWGNVGVRMLGAIGSNKIVIGSTTMRKEG